VIKIKYKIKIVLIALTLILPTSLALSNSYYKTKLESNYFDISITKYNEPQLYLLSSEEQFTHLEIIEHTYQINYSQPPSITFYTENNIHSNNNISILYYAPVDYTLLKKGKLDLLRILVPSSYYSNNCKYTTTSITLRIHYKEKPKSFVSQNDIQKVGTIIDNPEVLPTFDTQQSDFDPQAPDYEYIIITNESLWYIFNTYFKDWKITQDSKINDILIVNVSDLTSSDYWVNGSWGDGTNEDAGNPWIPLTKDVDSNWWLFNDTQAHIRNFLRQQYTENNTRYVLLGGNKNVVPPRMVCSRATGNGGASYDSDTSHASDMYYACLHLSMNNNTNSYFMENECMGYAFDEIDWGYDLCVGRVLVNTPLELFNWINKTKNYTDGNNQGNYLRNHVCAAKNGSNNIIDNTWLDLGGEYSASIGRQVIPITNITFVNNQNITQAQWTTLNDYCNGTVSGYDGIHMIFHAGHGGSLYSTTGGVYRPSISANQETPNFLYTEGCYSGNFGEVTNSRAENWMYFDVCVFAEIVNSAFGWFGASTYYVEEMLNQMFNESTANYTYTFCQAHNDAREIYGHSYGTPDWGLFAMIVKETNFFGDPAMEYQWYTEEEKPEFISIEGGLNLTTVYTSTPTFNWTLVSKASKYQLQISNDSAFTDVVLNINDISETIYPTYYTSNTTTISFILPYDLPYFNKIYYCRVRSYAS